MLERKYMLPFLLVTSLFFSWALAAQLNDVLIRQFQKALDLSRGQAGLIQTAFYFGYFFGAIPAAMFIKKFGYKNGILFGLGLYFIGAMLFYPAAEVRQYLPFLIALYIIAFGLAFLETAANPYVSSLGDEETAPARLNLAQGFYGLGAFLGPFLGSLFILSGVELSSAEMQALSAPDLEAYRVSEAKSVQAPYLVLAGGIAVLALIIAMVGFPRIKEEAGADSSVGISKLLRHRHLVLGVFTQFCYVGAQVSIWSFFIDFSIDVAPGATERFAAQLLSFGFIALMIGRFAGAFLMKRWAASTLLSLSAVISILLCAVATLASGWIAIGALWLTTFFMSIMFPTIFSLGINGLGPLKKFASSAMIMAIIGGAVFPPVMGLTADLAGIQASVIVPIAGFIVVLVYGLHGHRTNNVQSNAGIAS